MRKIKSVEMVRSIRDKHSRDTSGKSPKEIIDYFRRKAGEIAGKAVAPELKER